MKINLLLILLGLSTFPALAQGPGGATGRPAQQLNAVPAPQQAPRGNARISGVVLDAQTKQPVEFATVALLNPTTNAAIDGTVADDKGRFTLSKVAAGTYTINISFIGYQQLVKENVEVAHDNASVNLGTISLGSNSQNLNEVVVQGEKPLVEEKIDRTVYNAEKDITNAGGNAADVLQKVPSLSVDIDGNVQLRGSSNVRVLINNKPSSIMAGNIADALKQIPADMIKSVEVITSPSAKYDAEGSAGIINIILKKDGMQGISGSASLSAGTRSSNGNASLNVRRGKFGVNSTIASNMFYNRGGITSTLVTPDFEQSSFFSGDTRINGRFMNGQVGFEYDLNPKNSLSGGIRLNGGQFRMNNGQQFSETIGVEATHYLNDIQNRNKRMGIDYNLDFTHTFKPQQELTILSLYTTTDTDTRNFQDRYNPGEIPFYLQRNLNDGANDEFTLQVDYTHPFKNKTMLEVGAKSILRQVQSDALYDITKQGRQEIDRNIFDYGQDVYASYLTYGFTLKKLLNVKLGGRYEYTDINANLLYKTDLNTDRAKESHNVFEDSYDNFIPSVALSYSLKQKHTFKASFTQRIQRPSLFYLNPYRQVQASNIAIQGNPDLEAELTDLYEVGYSTFAKTTSFSANLYMRQTNNAIETVASFEPEDNSTTLSFQNIATNKTYGISLSGSTKPVAAWTLGGSSNIYYVDLKSKNNSNSGVMYNINANSSYTFGRGISAQFNGGFNSRRVQLLGQFAAFSYHSLAFKKELFGGKGGIALGMDNPFRRNMLMRNEISVSSPIAYEQQMRISNYNRGFKLTFNYAFGKMQQAPPKRKKSIRNDDAKQGDGGSGI